MQQKNDECTFKPQLSPYAKKMTENEAPIEQRTKTILEEREKKLSQLRKQLEEKQARLSFKPTISQYNFKEGKRLSFYESLDDQIQKRKESYASFEELRQKKEMEEAYFVPSISSYSKQLDRGEEPIHERLFRLSKSMNQLPADSLNPEASFHPTITTTPLKPRGGKIEDRLYNEAHEIEEKRKQIMEQIDREQKKMMKQKLSDSSRVYFKSKLDRQIQNVFQQVDTLNIKQITYKQLGEAMKKFGLFKAGEMTQRRSEQEVRIHESLWKAMDPNDTGYADFDNFKRIILAILDPSAIADEKDREFLTTELAEEIRLLHLNKLAFSKGDGFDEAVEQAKKLRDKELTFRPQINPYSKQIEESKNQLLVRKSQHVPEQSTIIPFHDQTSMSRSLIADHSTLNLSSHPKLAWSTISVDAPSEFYSFQSDRVPNHEVSSSQLAMNTPRYELLLKKQEELDKRKEHERIIKMQKDMKECTFKPNVSKSKHLDRRRKENSVSHFEYLYQQKDVPKKFSSIMDTTPTSEKELKACTFQPNRVHTKKYDKFLEKKKKIAENVTIKTEEKENDFSHLDGIDQKVTPRGYKEYVERLRKANEAEKFDYHKSLRENLKSDSVDFKTKKKTEFKPFNFQLNRERAKPKPLLFMDVNMGPGKTGRIGIHEGDDPNVLAQNFAQLYMLDPVLTNRLSALIKENMDKTLAANNTDPTRVNKPANAERRSKTPTATKSINKKGTQDTTSNNKLRSKSALKSGWTSSASKFSIFATRTNTTQSGNEPATSTKPTKVNQPQPNGKTQDKQNPVDDDLSIVEEGSIVRVSSSSYRGSSIATQTLSHETQTLLSDSPSKRNILDSLKELKQFTRDQVSH